MLKGFWGINIAVKDIDDAVTKYKDLLGVEPYYSNPEDFAFPGLKGAIFNFNGVLIGLVSPTDADNPVAKFLEKHGEGVLLVSLESENIEKDVARLKSKNVEFLFQKNVEGERFGKVNFIHPSNMHGVQVEIFQPSENFINLYKKE